MALYGTSHGSGSTLLDLRLALGKDDHVLSSRTWNMARKLKIMKNEKHPLDDFKNDKITKKREK